MWLKLVNWWSRIEQRMPSVVPSSLAPGEEFLAQATDAADLERRLVQLERQTSEAALVRLKAMAWARA